MDWKKIIEEWMIHTSKIKSYKSEFLSFFDKIINLAQVPEKAFFGTNKSTISIVIGHLYLGVYIHSGGDKGIGMIVDKEFNKIKGVVCKPVLSTLAKTSPHILYWLWIPDVSNLKNILDDKTVWESFKIASKLVIETPQGKMIREREKKGKVILTNLITPKEVISEPNYIEDLELQIASAKKLSKTKRREKLKETPEIPEKVLISATGFKRNPYVIIEVLERANGVCELCGNRAPFIRVKDGLPFLEVHHIEPLANGGKDTIGNTAALCPNCHREAHHGINKEKIKIKLKTIHNINL
jgi:5-methylcytosine-specific restriction endonuclease McrA